MEFEAIPAKNLMLLERKRIGKKFVKKINETLKWNMKMKIKNYPLEVIITIVSERLVCSMLDLYDILGHVTGDNIQTVALPRANEFAKNIIVDRFFSFNYIKDELDFFDKKLSNSLDKEKTVKTWVEYLKFKYDLKDSYEICSAEDKWERKSPIKDMIDLMKPKVNKSLLNPSIVIDYDDRYKKMYDVWDEISKPNDYNCSTYSAWENIENNNTIKIHDLTSSKPIVEGKVEVEIEDWNGKIEEMENPTWKDIAIFFTQFNDGYHIFFESLKYDDKNNILVIITGS